MQERSVKKLIQINYSSIIFVLYAVTFIIAATLPLFAGQYYSRFVVVMFIVIIISIGYNISAGYCGLINFGSAALYAAGAYGTAVMMVKYNMPFIGAFVVGILIACLLSFLISLPALRVSGHYLALLSLGLVEIVQKILIEWKGVTFGAEGITIPPISFFGSSLDWVGIYYLIFIVMLIALIVQRNIVKSYMGRAFRSIKNDSIAANSVGVNVKRFMIIAFLLSAVFAGVAGSLYAGYSGYISPDSFGFDYTVSILLVVIIGGSGTLSGPVIGTIIIIILPELFKTMPDAKQFFFGFLLILIPLLMPKGIMGKIKNRFHHNDNELIPSSNEIKKHFDLESYKLNYNSDAKNEYILELNNVSKYFGGLAAVSDLNIKIKPGTVHSLIGPNGAGKSTTVNMITGFDSLTKGEIIFNNKKLNGIKPNKIASMGISRTFQHVRLFGDMTVLENVMVGKHLNYKYGFQGALLHTPKMHNQEKINKEKAFAYLDAIGLLSKANEEARNLSSGQQKLLDLARALSMEPKLLVLDEPCAGLNDAEVNYFADLIKLIRNSGVTILLIEHHMNLVMNISDKITVLEYGKMIAEGTPKEIQINSNVRKAYLGTEVEEHA